MNTRRGLLSAVTVAMALAAVAAFLAPLLGSFKPSAKAGADLPRFDVSEVAPGTYKYFDAPYELSNEPWLKYLVLRIGQEEPRVYSVPVYEGQFRLPDLTWWRWGPRCKDFGPDANGPEIADGGIIRCHDPEVESWSDWYRNELRWALDGTNLGQRTEDMLVPKHSFEGKFLVVGKS